MFGSRYVAQGLEATGTFITEGNEAPTLMRTCAGPRWSHPPLEAIEEGGGGFAEGEAVAGVGGERRLGSEGLDAQTL